MKDTGCWDVVLAELDRWADAGRQARLWLRDDDAVAATPALSELLGLCRAHAAPILLAVVPAHADATLRDEIAERARTGLDVSVAVHGIAHQNHAPAGRKSEELALERGRADIVVAVAQARARLTDLFGDAAGRWYVPPWNRIAPEVASWLPECGFTVISTFGPTRFGSVPKLTEANTHIDIIDWKGGRIGRSPAWVASEIARQLGIARAESRTTLGVLTHHLVHDATAWCVLEDVLAVTKRHAGARWVSPDEVVRPAAAA